MSDTNFVNDLDVSSHILGHRMQLLQIRQHVCMPIKNIYSSNSPNYLTNSLSKLRKYSETSSCVKVSQNRFEVVQLLYCTLDLYMLQLQGLKVD